MKQHGKFITIEGVEGVGKSTSIEFIAALLARHDIHAISTREPGGTPLAEDIRQLLLDRANGSMDPLTELLLMFAARVQHVNELVKPALERGDWVICDRFTDSSYAYQGGGRGLDPAIISALENLALGQFRPDLTILLDMSVEEGMARAVQRGERDRFEAEGADFFNRVRQVFLERASMSARYHVVNAAGDVSSVQAELAPIIEAEITNAMRT